LPFSFFSFIFLLFSFQILFETSEHAPVTK